MREVFASINYVINKLEEKNLFKIAQEGHDIFAAVYRFVGQDGELVRPDDDKSEQYYESAAPSNMFENDLYSPMDKNKQRKWRVKSEVPSEYGTAPASSASPSATDTPSAETSSSETPSAGPSVAPESASTTTSTMPGPGTSSITVTTPSSYSGTEGTSSGASSATGTPQGSGPSFSTGSGASTVDPTKVEYFDIKTLIKIVDHFKEVSKASDLELIEKLKLDKTIVSKALDVLIKLGAIRYNNYNYQFNKSFDQVTQILTEYMKHHNKKIQESLSAEDNDDDIIDVDVEDPNENTNEVRQIGERNNPASDETKIPGGSFGSENRSSGGFFGGGNQTGGFFGGGNQIGGFGGGDKPRWRKVYPSTMEEIQKTQEKLDVIVKELDKILRMPNDRKTKGVFTNFLSNKDLVDIVSDPNFEQNYSINSDTMMNIEFIHYPGENIVGLKINGKPVIQFGKRR